MDKLFLLDAYALIYRAYYAFIKSPRINSKGFNTSAVLGFVNTLEEVLKKENPTHIGVAFDPAGIVIVQLPQIIGEPLVPDCQHPREYMLLRKIRYRVMKKTQYFRRQN